MLISFIFLKTVLLFGASALSLSPPNLIRKNPPATPPFNATITDHNGLDITSSFQIRLFQPPPQKNTTTTNLADRQTGSIRLINFCPIASHTFISSHCSPSNGAPGSLQTFTRICRLSSSVWRPAPGRTSFHPHRGYCNANEICISMTSQIALEGGRGMATVPTAACVDQLAYYTWNTLQEWGFDPGNDPAWVQLFRLSGMRVFAAASEADGRTPLDMESLGIRAGKGGVEVEREGCADCSKLVAGTLPVGTDSLRAEARLLSVGAVAATGILWVAVLAG